MSRIFLKDLPNWTTKEALDSKFSRFGKITDIKLIKSNSKKGKMFGFIGFYDKKSSAKVLNHSKFFFLKNQKILIEQAYPKMLDLPPKKKENTENSKKKTILFENSFETGILLVQNLPHQIPELEIRKLFLPFGFINNIFIKKNTIKATNSFQVFVEFGLPECAIKAASFLDGKIFRGKIIHILPFQGKNFFPQKEKKEFFFLKFKRLREEVDIDNSIDQRSWYTLFVPQDKIIKILSLKYGKTKKIPKIYEKLYFNLTKLSLSEARIQNEVSLFLKYFGINMNAFNPDLIHKKSRRTLIIKNIIFEEKFNLRNLFRKFGKITQFIILPIIKFVLVEYQKKRDASEAFNFFKKKKIKEKNILIEWAPLNSLISKKNMILKNKKKIYDPNFENLIFFKEKKSSFFRPNENSAKKFFFLKNHNENSILQTKNFINLNLKKGNNLFRKNFKDPGKILVKNIPFELNILELKKIYENFGKILAIRLPKKSPKQHKGFAFIEFEKIEDAKKAVLSTQNIHLFSRHLCVNLLKNL